MLQKFHEKNRDLLININGRLLHRDQAGISPFDSVVQGGDAVWEGLRVYHGRIFTLHEHLDRLLASARALSFQNIPSKENIIVELRRTLEANQLRHDTHIRLTLTRGVKYTSGMDPRLNTSGPTLIIIAEHKPPVYDKTGIRLITATIRRPGPDVLDARIHHNNLLNSILAKIQANAAAADDALMLDGRGFIAETNATHIFLVTRGVIETPHCVSCPDGITRKMVLRLCREKQLPHGERDLTSDEAYRADEMFCTGTMGELVPVVDVDGHPIGNRQPGPLTRQLSEWFGELTAKEGMQIV